MNAISGLADGDFIIAFEANASALDDGTLYQWDSDPGGVESIPYTVDGTGGRWLAFAGAFQTQAVNSDAAQNKIRHFWGIYKAKTSS